MTDAEEAKTNTNSSHKLDDKRTGICLIKPEYIIEGSVRSSTNDNLKENDKDKIDKGDCVDNEPEKKRLKENYRKNKPRGQNKGRKLPFKTLREHNLCPWIANLTVDEARENNECPNDACVFIHERVKYLEIKPDDIGTECHIFKSTGKCQRGASCRFGSQHITKDGFNIIDKEKYEIYKNISPRVKNKISKEIVEQLKKYRYNFTKAEKIGSKYNWKPNKMFDKSREIQNLTEMEDSEKKVGPIMDTEEIKLRVKERRRIDWKDKVMLAPLTTVGNLPFRRICKEYGADITCGEMAMAPRLLKGMREEWALVKRHECEDIFGVQITGNNPGVLTRCAQLLNDEIEVDFLDLNLACPIDLVYKQGAGCGMLNRPYILESVVQSCNEVLDIPLTVKTRTAVYVDVPIAHTLMPKFKQWGVSMINIHGRSREQRYTKLANWDYIELCAKEAEPVPVYGTGDILSYDDYARMRTTYPTVHGVSIGRGALIKPWIFQEIKEQRLIDVSSSERFEMLKKYTNYGLEHWGSDTRGVENTRRFMLEWISFLYRYVPVGILKNPPQRMNNRPPYYKGRDELETLMASPNCADWVKLSEMLLGKVPDGFNFLPKHKANAWN
ncbi:PREDICTED: tRNA-dihydrouridine(47) synthase [NAD(P)(+)]-like [Ceratosolen solmsi marchali]|uniref:tRNA-dihydrouridine(47) synthase [NAD(P)(+)] n=1 Tax=Ceratosolen solmsi marchali TaxID=326594 RepID=A0AAJ6VMS7_9HYME|nr:PREDICTED: tRNA-dihydrouridine(47) synthase [NAD(P)(+)]-like [Ceratosolen solmsi marchali]